MVESVPDGINPKRAFSRVLALRELREKAKPAFVQGGPPRRSSHG